ncbi:hypothetical protein DSO57_1012144 [Entomophthora muscae]|uniref:Uncharacterized protein n=1 Tax=Entomophthora muscae TaxID=34485 RepID=A0ACC2U4S0_9FUNG|nr:hypothetical protein DSO57_1012144 [Entomophthora muscae]
MELVIRVDKIFQQVKDVANREIGGLKLWEKKSVEIMTKWQNENTDPNQKVAFLEAKLTEALLQEVSSNKGLNKHDYGNYGWMGLDPAQAITKAGPPASGITPPLNKFKGSSDPLPANKIHTGSILPKLTDVPSHGLTYLIASTPTAATSRSSPIISFPPIAAYPNFTHSSLG